MKWLPNAFSIGRMALAPVIAVLIVLGMGQGTANGLVKLACVLFVVSALTDWIDGYLARKLDAKSELGGKLDLWGDKLLVGLCLPALLIGWINLGSPYPSYLSGLAADPIATGIGLFFLAAIPLRDSLVTRLRAKREADGVTLAPTFFAKSKTAVIMTALGIVLAGLATNVFLIALFGFVLLIVGALMSIWSGIRYQWPKKAKQRAQAAI